MTTPPEPVTTPDMSTLGEGWAPIPEAALRLGISVKTLRRRIQASEVEARMVHDPAIGLDRWMVKAPEPPPKADVISVEVLARLEEAWQKVSELNARAEVAERVAEFERERRESLERQVEELRARLDTAGKDLEATDRIQTSTPRRWWQRPR